jgi:hypothetical protein
MGRQTTILQVFVASPDDLKSERIALESVIRELNQMHSESTGAYLELVKWETHAVPGFGSDPQAVINEQIADKYDIFIGMLSTKFGSPTPRAGSGTEEEFQRAYDRFIKNPNELRIMFYFKDPELRASEIDLDQYKRVKEFKNKLREKGLYATFNTTEEFVAMVRLHLSRQLQEWAEKKWGSQITTQTAPETESTFLTEETVTEDEELGFLDYVEIGNDSLESGTASLSRIEEAISDVGHKTSESTPKLTAAIEEGDVAKQKQVLNSVARVLEEFGLRIDTELPIFSNSYSTGIDAISRSAILWEADFNLDDKTPIRTVHDNVESLLAAIITSSEAMRSMEQTISGLPRLTANFNKAKKHAAQSLAGLNRALSGAQNLTTEALRELKRILGDNCEPTEEQLLKFMHTDTRQAYEGEMTAKQRQELRDAEVARWKQANC